MTHHPLLPAGAFIDDEGIWVEVLPRPRASRHVPALFLDRDGTIIEDVGHLADPEKVTLIDGAAEVVAMANHRGIIVVIVTNQSGIGRGLFGWDSFIEVQDRMLRKLARNGAFVDAVFACPHHADGKPPYDDSDHPCRKPNPGMLHRAASLLPLDLARSWMIGDRASDIAAARTAGLAGGLHVATGWGHWQEERDAALAESVPAAFEIRAGPSIGTALTAVPILAADELI